MERTAPYFDVVKNVTNSRPWSLRTVTVIGPNVLHGDVKFRSRAKAQDWADRMNAAASKCTPKTAEQINAERVAMGFPSFPLREEAA